MKYIITQITEPSRGLLIETNKENAMTRFEHWVLETSRRAGTHIDKSTSGAYLDNRVSAKYAAWKASKTLPTAKQILDTYHLGVVEYDLGTNAGICMLVMDVVERMNKEDI